MSVVSVIGSSGSLSVGSVKRGRQQSWPTPWFSRERAGRMSLTQIVSRIFSRHDRRHTVIDQTIDRLQQEDRELERRLKLLKDQVDVYQRTSAPEDRRNV
jgi:uncharacterized Ntn-hydrolase superfamily protein